MTIDWIKIREEYPKCFKLLKESGVYNEHDYYGYINTNDRDLYDFFDNANIQVWVKPIMENFSGYVDRMGHHLCIKYIVTNDRVLTETETFYEAFKILENEL